MANKVLTHEETVISFLSSAGSAVLTLTSLANNALRVSAQYDRGAAAVATRYRWRAKLVLGATTTGVAIGQTASIFIATADTHDNTKIDGNVGTSDATAASIDKRRNLTYLGVVEVDKTVAAGDVYIGSGVVDIEARYLSAGAANELGNALSSTATDHGIWLTPMPPELQ